MASPVKRKPYTADQLKRASEYCRLHFDVNDLKGDKFPIRKTDEQTLTCAREMLKEKQFRKNLGPLSTVAMNEKTRLLDAYEEKHRVLRAGGELNFGHVSAGDFSTPTVGVRVNTELNIELAWWFKFFAAAEVAANKSLKPGEGSSDDTQLFGPGPKSKLKSGAGFSSAAVGLSLSGPSKTDPSKTDGEVKLSYGIIESSFYSNLPLKMILGGIKSHGVSNTQMGLHLSGKTPLIGDRLRLSGGITYGSTIDNLDLLGGNYGYVLHEEGDLKGQPVKQLDMGLQAEVLLDKEEKNKKSIIVHYHYVRSSNARETASHAWSFGTRLLFDSLWEFGGDLHWSPVLESPVGQSGSSYSAALQVKRIIERDSKGKEKQYLLVSGGGSNKTITRGLLGNSEGSPQVGTPEDPITETSLYEIGLTYLLKPFAGRIAYIKIPEGDGVALNGAFSF